MSHVPELPDGRNAKGFSRAQLRQLTREIDARHIHTRELDGRELTYIEGWYAIAQANAIFGYAGWDREMVHFERIAERSSQGGFTSAYMARVRIRVRAGTIEIVREGTGWGAASAAASPAASERALKAAETDATKRALSTFGSRFGLNLYDKDNPLKARPSFALFDPDGRLLADSLSPEAFSSGLRQLIELCRDVRELDRLAGSNAVTIEHLRNKVPSLRNAQGTHFSDLLLRLLERKRERLANPGESTVSADDVQSSDAASRQSSPSVGHWSRPSQLESRRALQYPARISRRRAPPPQGPARRAVASTEGATSDRASTSSDVVTAEAAESSRPAMSQKGVAPVCDASPVHQVIKSVSEAAAGEIPEEPTANSAAGETGTERGFKEGMPNPGGGYNVAAPTSTINSGGNEVNAAASASMEINVVEPPARIDKSRLFLAVERRLRDKAHLKRIAQLPCVICSRQPSQAHHLRFAQKRGMSQKVSDEYTVPLCGLHHGDLHRSSSEPDWWIKQKIDPLPISTELWAKHHPL